MQIWLGTHNCVDEAAIVSSTDVPDDNYYPFLGRAFYNGRQIILYEQLFRDGLDRTTRGRFKRGDPLWKAYDQIGTLTHEVLHILHTLPTSHDPQPGRQFVIVW